MKTKRCLISATLLLLLAAGACTKESTTGGGAKNELACNRKIDDFLQKRYLWNDEYNRTDRDLAQTYASDGNNFLITTLMKMSTNDLDKKRYIGNDGKPYYRLYSNVTRTEAAKKAAARTTRGVNHNIAKETVYGFGFANMMAVRFVDGSGNDTGNYGLICSAVYPDSPAAGKGFARGMIIAELNGEKITAKTLDAAYASLTSPDGAQTLTVTENRAGAQPVSLTAGEMYPNPVLRREIIREGADRIGYLVYTGFDAAYDDEVLEAVGSFREAGITDLILDLRYNSGGHVISSNMLSTCIAGTACENRVFQYYRYNDSRMADIKQTTKETGNSYDQSARKFFDSFAYGDYYGVDLRTYALNLRRLFVLVTESTASSSEALVNALLGIGIDVTLIGEQTSGKNVGMEVYTFTSDEYSYELAPITFQGYNAREETVPSDGLRVDYQVREWQNDLADFGAGDPLVDKALSLVTGRNRIRRETRSVPDDPNRVPEIVPGIRLPQPADAPHGMIVLPPDTIDE